MKDDQQVEGISAEDQREILLEIERVAGENRISISEGLFDFAARKNGALFPIMVNLAGIALLAAGIASMLWFFRSGEEQLLEAGRGVVTAESRLIEEIRRETEAQLAAKDSEIQEIQEQLAAISREREALSGDIEGRIAQREAQLRQELEQELEAERQRLRSLNLSEEEIEQRMASFAAVKEREFNQRLDQFQRQAEAERDRLARELDDRESQFNETLARAGQERDTLLQESAARLTAMQQEFEARIAAGQAQLGEAREELARLSQQQEREQLLRGQIRGLYQSSSTALRANDYDSARARLRDLRTLLNEESLLRIPALREQRPVELMVVEALESLITLQERFGTPEAQRRLADGERVAQVQQLVEQAGSALAAGDAGAAMTLYRQALEVIPAVSESFRVIGDADAGDDGEQSAAELASINQEAQSVLTAADLARADGDLDAALTGYLRVLDEFSRSRFRSDAAEGVALAVAAMESQSAEALTALTGQAAELEADRAALADDLAAESLALAASRTELTRLTTEAQQLRQRVAELETGGTAGQIELTRLQNDLAQRDEQLTAARQRAQQLEETVAAREATLGQTEEELLQTLEELAIAQARGGTALDPATLAELERLRDLETDLSAAGLAWEDYRRQAVAVAADSDQAQVMTARVALERFFNEASMRRFFPGMASEVERFDAAFLASGRENALLDAADLLTEISFAETATERLSLIRSARRGADPALVELLTELEELLR